MSSPAFDEYFSIPADEMRRQLGPADQDRFLDETDSAALLKRAVPVAVVLAAAVAALVAWRARRRDRAPPTVGWQRSPAASVIPGVGRHPAGYRGLPDTPSVEVVAGRGPCHRASLMKDALFFD